MPTLQAIQKAFSEKPNFDDLIVAMNTNPEKAMHEINNAAIAGLDALADKQGKRNGK